MKALFFAFALAILLSTAGCSLTQPPNLIDELQTQAQIKNGEIPTQLTDLGIMRYGEKILAAWGMRSRGADILGTGGAIALASLSTAALATSGANSAVHADTTRGIIAGAMLVIGFKAAFEVVSMICN